VLTGNITQLYEFLTKTNDLLVKNSGSLDNVRSTFTMHEHSLGILAVLYVQLDFYLTYNNFVTVLWGDTKYRQPTKQNTENSN